MEHATSIEVRLYVGCSPNYRDSAAVLFEGIECGMEIVTLDFVGVDFISRSFADQLHKERLRFQERCGAIVVIENTSDDVHRMMQAVANTQSEIIRDTTDLPVIRVQNVADLERRLLLG